MPGSHELGRPQAVVHQRHQRRDISGLPGCQVQQDIEGERLIVRYQQQAPQLFPGGWQITRLHSIFQLEHRHRGPQPLQWDFKVVHRALRR